MAERLGTGLQNLLQRFDSASHLSINASELRSEAFAFRDILSPGRDRFPHYGGFDVHIFSPIDLTINKMQDICNSIKKTLIFVMLFRQQTYKKRLAYSARVNLDSSIGCGKSENACTGYNLGFAHAIAESVSFSLLISTLWLSRANPENKIRGSRFLL